MALAVVRPGREVYFPDLMARSQVYLTGKPDMHGRSVLGLLHLVCHSH